jgi:hypothetical protein
MSLDNLEILGVVIALVAVVLSLGAAGIYRLNKAVDQNGG